VVIVVIVVTVVTVVTVTVVTVDTVVTVVTLVTVRRPSPDCCTDAVSVYTTLSVCLKNTLVRRNPIGLSHSSYVTKTDLLCFRPHLRTKKKNNNKALFMKSELCKLKEKWRFLFCLDTSCTLKGLQR
jgi:hypothetical protein